MKFIAFALILLFAISGADAKVALSKKDRAMLTYHHSVMKKSHVQIKKADLNALRSELKKEKKAKKAARSAGGI